MPYPDPPTSDPSTVAGQWEWDIYLRRRGIEQAASDAAAYRQALAADTASRNALAASEQALAAAQQSGADAQRAMVAVLQKPEPLFSPQVIAQAMRIAQVEAPDDWVNRTMVRLQQIRTAFNGAFVP